MKINSLSYDDCIIFNKKIFPSAKRKKNLVRVKKQNLTNVPNIKVLDILEIANFLLFSNHLKVVVPLLCPLLTRRY